MFDQAQNRIASSKRRYFQFGIFRRFVRRQEGATAVEFALLALPFLAVMFAILETALVFLAGQALETAATNSARTIMTGQAQNGRWDKARFQQEVCGRILGLFNCADGIKIDVKTYPSFANADFTKPVDENGNLQANFAYQPGGPGDIVVVRLIYQWPLLMPLLGLDLADMPNGKRLLIATSAFRNEPFQGAAQ